VGRYEYKAKSGSDTFPLFQIQGYAEVGKQYTLSFELKSTVDGAVFKNNTLYVNDALTVTHNSPELIKDKYVKVYGSFTYVEGGSYVHIYINGVTNADELYLRNWKLEKGTKATDWTPAPEDQVSDWNETDVASLSYIKNKPTQLSQFIDNIGIVNLTTNQTITGAKTFNANITLGVNRYIQGTDNYTGVWNVDDLLWRFGSSKTGSVSNIRSEKVGIGTDNPLYKLDVAGTGRFTGNVTAPTFIGALSGNASSATKLQTARTIAGVSFDGTANIAIPFANLASKPTTLSGYGITDAVTLNTAQTITGEKTFNANITLGINKYIKGTDNYTGVWNVDDKLWRFGSSSSGSVSNIRSEKVGIGTDTPSQKLHVAGNILATSEITANAGVNTPKVDFGNGFTVEPSGTELVFKYNGVIKQRMLSDGTILATGGVTALATS